MAVPTSLRFEALGALRVWGDTELAITRPARRRVLSILLLETELSVVNLIDRIWGDDPPGDPRNAVQAHVAGLRRQLGAVIDSTPDGYRLDRTGHSFDVDEFRRRVAECDAVDPTQPEVVAATAAQALSLWRGDPFPDVADDLAARGAIGGLIETRLQTVIRWVDAMLAMGRVDEALPRLEALVVERPFEERCWERLMLARYRAGNTVGALRAFQTLRASLGHELGIEPGPRLRALEERILLHDPALGVSTNVPTPHNLPPTGSSFVGRRDDIDGVVGLLESHRLVTVTGGPGLGKTRLAVEVGRQVIPSSVGGVWLARLVGATSVSDVTATIAAAAGVDLGVSDLSELAEAVSVRPQVLILDNCEHVHDAVRDFVAACLRIDGPLRILATSRRRLGVGGEQVWRLSALSVPTSEHDVFESDAVRLLIDRAESADRSFRARDADPAQLAALCRRTDGIPLAIELAATWLPSIGVDEVIDLAGDPAPGAFRGLDSHHRSLRHAVDWSFGLLSESDQRLVEIASVFRGSFVLEAFRAVCAPDASPAESAGAVSRLVESSLLVPERRDGGLRYRMLEPVREYGAARLEESGGAAAAGVRHARWLLRRAIALGEVIGRETDPAKAQRHIDAELADFRAAMQFFLDAGEHESAASLATRLTGYWFARYLGWEAIRWLDSALEGTMPDSVRVQATWTAGWAAYSRADYATATNRYEESQGLAERIGDRGAVGRALFGLGRIELPRDPARGRTLVREALAVFAEAGLERERGDCLLALGFTAARRGEVADAEALLGEGLEIMERCGSLRSRAIGHRYLSMAAWHSSERDKAMEHADEAERLARLADDRPALGGALIQRAFVEARWGSTAVAASAVIEALDQLPTRHEIDHCLVFFGALDVLFGTGHSELAARVLGHVDRVFAEYGWVSVDVRMPVVSRWRALAAATEGADWPSVSSADLAKVIRSALSDIAQPR